jgi:ubiquinone/menaquinone biosynthesis C-methylase UbiE
VVVAVGAVRSNVTNRTYVHSYRPRENERLQDQAGTLDDLFHSDTAYPSGSMVLEVGCSAGAQTLTLSQRCPEARFTSIDVSAASIAEAKRRADRAELTNVEFRQADIFALPFNRECFDHVFVCFVLEHLSRPVEALGILNELLRPGGARSRSSRVITDPPISTLRAPTPARRSSVKSRCSGRPAATR